MATKLGIIAGGGDLPVRICEACEESGRPFFVVAIENHADIDQLARFPHAVLRLGAAGKALKAFKKEGVRDLVMAGKVSRPSLAQLRPDAEALKFFATVGKGAGGDDDLLTRVANYFQDKHGFNVVSVGDVLGPTGAASGLLTETRPDEARQADIDRGLFVLKALGPADVGQAVVVQEGLVLGVEAIEGTDALIERCGALKRPGPGPVLVKIAKPGQDNRVDLPTIGEQTVERVSAAGFSGIAIEADRTIIVDRDATVAAADRARLFITAVTL
ncbi:LpxI family protein [Hwanghaeella sp.]|uniref:LpxI family protein n=1 Tax=Hwanghaeella sp. TaxID=2605943 RepID=UPI003CCC0A39